jgi:undecaprenyl pyrophosphate phosphatase UppP
MGVLALLALITTSDGTTRLILLLLMVIAVLLIITGCIIALITWRKRLKAQNAYLDSTQWSNKT